MTELTEASQPGLNIVSFRHAALCMGAGTKFKSYTIRVAIAPFENIRHNNVPRQKVFSIIINLETNICINLSVQNLQF